MKKKTKKHQRFLALVLCIIIALTCSAMVYAETPADKSSDNANASGDVKPETREINEEETKHAKELGQNINETPKVQAPVKAGYEYIDISSGLMVSGRSVDLFRKLLQTKIKNVGKDIVNSVWVPAAKAALLSSGSYYKVNGSFAPHTFDQSFEKFTNKGDSNKYAGSIHFSNMTGMELKTTTSFENVAATMIEELKGDAAKNIYKGLKGDKKAYDVLYDKVDLGSLKDYKGDILFLTFTQTVSQGSTGNGNMGKFYDSFGICFYDFELHPVAEKLSTNENSEASTYLNFIDETQKITSRNVNQTSEEIGYSITKTDSTSNTTSNTVSSTETYDFTEGTNISYSHNFDVFEGVAAFKDQITVSMNLSFHQSNSKTKSNTTGTNVQSSKSQTITGKLPPATQVYVTQSTATAEAAIAYSCPVEFRYKVAVLSICGDYGGTLPYRTVKSKYAGIVRIFGDTGSYYAGDALSEIEDLYKNPNNDPAVHHLVWEKDYKPNTDALNKYRYYSGIGGIMTYDLTVNSSTVSPITPAYPLKGTEVDVAKTVYSINLCEEHPDDNSLNLSVIDVNGFAYDSYNQKVDYYGFDRKNGSWKLCDESGNVITSSKLAEVKKDITGTTYLEAKAEGTVYLKYEINDKVFLKDPSDSSKGYLSAKDIKENAIVKVVIKDSGKPSGLNLDANSAPEARIDSETNKAVIDLNTVDGLDVTAYNSQGKAMKSIPSYTWELAKDYDTCTLTEEGIFTATKAGEYSILVDYHDVKSRAVTIKIEEASVPVSIEIKDTSDANSPLQNLKKNAYADEVYNLFSENSPVVFCVTDQYGETREMTDSEKMDLGWFYEGKEGGIYINAGELYTYEPGEYQVYVLYGDIKSNMVDLTVK